jgi:hypothetical protein
MVKESVKNDGGRRIKDIEELVKKRVVEGLAREEVEKAEEKLREDQDDVLVKGKENQVTALPVAFSAVVK